MSADAEILTPAEIVESVFKNANLVEIVPGIKLPKLTLDDPEGTIGLMNNGSLGERKDSYGRDNKRRREILWISDCILFITTETQADDKTELTFEGLGAKDGRHVKFTLPAQDLADSRKFKGAFINAFGAQNKFGKMNFEYLQEITLKAGATRVIKRIEIPKWVNNIPLIPGVQPKEDIEFKLSSTVPARVHEGDLEEAKDVLRDLLSCHKYAPIVATVAFSSPATARWRPDDRIAVALWALTGTHKTTTAQLCMSMYGTEYLSDRYLIKAGGNTVVAEELKMAAAGILPVIYDNVKTVDPKMVARYVALIQMVIEGNDRGRGTKEAKVKEALTYLCSMIITGEVRPEEASTDARVLNLTWSKPDLGLLTEVQDNVELMPVIGYHWLRFLAQTPDDMIDGFSEARTKYEKKFAEKEITNPGRLATIYTVLRFTWNLLLRSPLKDVFEDYTEDFITVLDEAVEEQGDIVNNDTEASKFLNALDSLMASQPQLFQPEAIDGSVDGRIIGKHTAEGFSYCLMRP